MVRALLKFSDSLEWINFGKSLLDALLHFFEESEFVTVRVPKQFLSTYTNLHPTGRFTILESRHQEIGYFYLVQERRATDFEAPKL